MGISLVLGGGSARGLAHLGVLEVLVEEGIPIDRIVGCSMGSLIGGLYACGCDLNMVEGLATQMPRNVWMDIFPSRMGLLRGRKLEDLLRLLTRQATFADLRIPFSVVAVDIERGERVVLESGPVAVAIRASTAIPGVFHPVRVGERLLVDGGVLDRLPVDVARSYPQVPVVAVDVRFGGYAGIGTVRNVLQLLLYTRDLMEWQMVRGQVEAADVTIQPDLGDVAPADFHRAEEAIVRGRDACLESLPALREVLKRAVW